MRTEQEFLAELEECMTMTDADVNTAKQALMDMVTGNPISAMKAGLQIAEATLQRVRVAIDSRKMELGE